MRLTVGELLYRFRIQREVEARQVCRGLCSTSAMSYFESGERIPDTLLFSCMVECMGVSPEEFSLMVTGEEHVYYAWQEMVYQVIEKEDWEVLGNFLQSKITKKIYCNKKLEKQFFSYAKGIYLASQEEYAKGADMLKIAQEQTIPELTILQKEAILLSTVELNILILFLYYGVKGQVLDEKAGMDFYHILEQYMIHEYLSSKRKEHQFTQEKLSEGICEPETYSRVENGKRAPSRKNFKALAERLGIDWCNYRGELDTCELKAYQLRRKLRKLMTGWKNS